MIVRLSLICCWLYKIDLLGGKCIKLTHPNYVIKIVPESFFPS